MGSSRAITVSLKENQYQVIAAAARADMQKVPELLRNCALKYAVAKNNRREKLELELEDAYLAGKRAPRESRLGPCGFINHQDSGS